MRQAARVDDNHAEIVSVLRKVGCLVTSLAAVGKGVPDLLVGYRGRLWLMEIKDGSKPPSARKLTEQQVTFHALWHEWAVVVSTVDEALEAIGHA